jgi:predicted transposase/invertase (TIGR01784 family)
MTKINNPHDKGYKYLLSSRKLFLEFVESFIDRGISDQLDVQSVTRIDKSYILPDFNGKEADLVYRLKLKEQEIFIYLLLELQSTVDFLMPYRLHQYTSEILRDVFRNTPREIAEGKGFKFPRIIPVVLYNGISEWSACRSFNQMFAAVEPVLDGYGIDLKYFLIDVNRYPEEILTELPNRIKTAFLLDQKDTPEGFLRRFKKVISFLETLPLEDYSFFMVWLQTVAVRSMPEKAEEVTKIITQSRPGEVAKVVYNLEHAIREMKEEAITAGKAEGILEGKLDAARKMLAKNMSEELISEFTGLSEEQIKKLKEDTAGETH